MNSNNLPSLPINADSCFAPNCNKTLDESPMYLVPIDERTRALCFQAVGLEIDALSCAKKNIFACSNHHSYVNSVIYSVSIRQSATYWHHYILFPDANESFTSL